MYWYNTGYTGIYEYEHVILLCTGIYKKRHSYTGIYRYMKYHCIDYFSSRGRWRTFLSGLCMKVCTCHVLCNISWSPKWKNPVFRMCGTNIVHTGRYRYILVHHDTHTQRSKPFFTATQALSALQRRRVSQPRLNFPSRAAVFLSVVSLTVRPPRRGLPRPNCHSHGLTS